MGCVSKSLVVWSDGLGGIHRLYATCLGGVHRSTDGVDELATVDIENLRNQKQKPNRDESSSVR